jgi:hypothetical protein
MSDQRGRTRTGAVARTNLSTASTLGHASPQRACEEIILSGHSRAGACEEISPFVPAEASRKRGPICGRPPACKGWQCADRSDCDHMYGLVTRSRMTAAKMGSATRVPNSNATTRSPLGPSECLASWDRSDRTICFLASFGLGTTASSAGARKISFSKGSWWHSFLERPSSLVSPDGGPQAPRAAPSRLAASHRRRRREAALTARARC